MDTYTIGSILKWSAVLTGIVKERIWCSACREIEKEQEPIVYLVIWHSILAGVELEADKAEERLRAIDRLDLIG
jgi:hypothetical protein